MADYWNLVGNPSGEVYRNLIRALCRHSDEFYFITRQELSYDHTVIDQFEPYITKRTKSRSFAQTLTLGPPATVYVVDSVPETCELLLACTPSLYDWVAPELPEDLTFLKNGFSWFSCTTHEEQAAFS